MSFRTSSQHGESSRGFSFLEVIISIFVLSVGFLGVVNLATNTLRISFLQRDAVIASMLAQEGIEMAYNIRDTNVAKGGKSRAFDGDGNASTKNDNIETGEYKIDYATPQLVSAACPGTTVAPCRLSLNASNFYTHAGGASPTRFSRKVVVSDTSAGGVSTRKIVSVVVWGNEGFPGGVISPSTCGKSTHCSFIQAELQENN